MPRIQPPDGFDERQLTELSKSPQRADGRPLNLFATLARRPALMARVNALGGYFATRALLDARTRELVILRTAGTLGCDYELRHHRPAARDAGLTAEQVAAAVDPAAAHDWDGHDRALLDAVDELLTARTLSEQRWAALRDVLDEDRCLEVVTLAGFYSMLALALNALQVDVDPS